VYVHVPFCARRCSYCDFAIAIRREVPVSEYLSALEAELRTRLAASSAPRQIESLYFGGGTPSHLGPDGVARLLDVMRQWFFWDARAEVTLEANPDDVTAIATSAWRAAGITRVSLGAQTFDPAVLAWMHRSHSAEQIDVAVQLLRDAGFESWSFDLIFALPEALKRDWARDLDLALAKAPPHLSLYGLTVEPGTALSRWRDRGEVQLTDESTYETEFLRAHTEAAAAGYDHYEVSNFAKPGQHARHNRAYWQGTPYLGFGPSAHGFDGARRRWNHAAYAAWQAAASGGVDPVSGSEPIGPTEAALESVYLGLRTTAGFELRPGDADIVARWVEAGWALVAGNRVVLTPLGWLRLDSLAAALTAAEAFK
jgi:oxygen-independent coproporphyrinogen III oxidase